MEATPVEPVESSVLAGVIAPESSYQIGFSASGPPGPDPHDLVRPPWSAPMCVKFTTAWHVSAMLCDLPGQDKAALIV